ncbi:beta-1,6-N-acetylglucosaminyltransferase [Pinibacter soli]|nr:beta-1,6-N-acetylglucosaminyltransferase [Pinibacter soli]
MKMANIVILHQYPGLAARMIKRLHHPQFDFYLHLDKKVDIFPFEYLATLPNTRFVTGRKNVNWGGFSQLEAIEASLDAIFSSGRSYDCINLLSGQDYPIKPTGDIHAFFEAHPGVSFLASETPPSLWWDEAIQRITRYHLIDYNFRGKHRLENILSLLLPERNFSLPAQLYGGPLAAYWTISASAAVYLQKSLAESNHRFFFKHTWSPDEFLINTILMNSPFRDHIVNDNYRYIDRSKGGAHPKVLTMADLSSLQSSSRLFARKFDPIVDARVLDRIDETILRPKRKV